MKIVNTDPNHLDTFEATLRALAAAAVKPDGPVVPVKLDTVYWGEVTGNLVAVDGNAVELGGDADDQALFIPILDIYELELT